MLKIMFFVFVWTRGRQDLTVRGCPQGQMCLKDRFLLRGVSVTPGKIPLAVGNALADKKFLT